MGHIYYRQEKYGMAEYHFRRALQVGSKNGSNCKCRPGMPLPWWRVPADVCHTGAASCSCFGGGGDGGHPSPTLHRSLQINERSSVLRCYLGMALHKLKRNKEALDELGQVGTSGCCREPVGSASACRLSRAMWARAGSECSD